MNSSAHELIGCPYCHGEASHEWAEERGFRVVRCDDCRFLYLNPRLKSDVIEKAVETGVHAEAGGLDIAERRNLKKHARYRALFRRVFADVAAAGKPVSWLDVGCGYGEIMQAAASVLPPGSHVAGLEPMKAKADVARGLGLDVRQAYLGGDQPPVDIISVIDVFSHLPDVDGFLATVHAALKDNGHLFFETGNLADVPHRSDFPGELGLPDHLAFAGEAHIRGYLERNGFRVEHLRADRIDNLPYFVKSVVKKLIGRDVRVRAPFSSPYRTLTLRARKIAIGR